MSATPIVVPSQILRCPKCAALTMLQRCPTCNVGTAPAGDMSTAEVARSVAGSIPRSSANTPRGGSAAATPLRLAGGGGGEGGAVGKSASMASSVSHAPLGGASGQGYGQGGFSGHSLVATAMNRSGVIAPSPAHPAHVVGGASTPHRSVSGASAVSGLQQQQPHHRMASWAQPTAAAHRTHSAASAASNAGALVTNSSSVRAGNALPHNAYAAAAPPIASAAPLISSAAVSRADSRLSASAFALGIQQKQQQQQQQSIEERTPLSIRQQQQQYAAAPPTEGFGAALSTSSNNAQRTGSAAVAPNDAFAGGKEEAHYGGNNNSNSNGAQIPALRGRISRVPRYDEGEVAEEGAVGAEGVVSHQPSLRQPRGVSIYTDEGARGGFVDPSPPHAHHTDGHASQAAAAEESSLSAVGPSLQHHLQHQQQGHYQGPDSAHYYSSAFNNNISNNTNANTNNKKAQPTASSTADRSAVSARDVSDIGRSISHHNFPSSADEKRGGPVSAARRNSNTSAYMADGDVGYGDSGAHEVTLGGYGRAADSAAHGHHHHAAASQQQPFASSADNNGPSPRGGVNETPFGRPYGASARHHRDRSHSEEGRGHGQRSASQEQAHHHHQQHQHAVHHPQHYDQQQQQQQQQYPPHAAAGQQEHLKNEVGRLAGLLAGREEALAMMRREAAIVRSRSGPAAASSVSPRPHSHSHRSGGRAGGTFAYSPSAPSAERQRSSSSRQVALRATSASASASPHRAALVVASSHSPANAALGLPPPTAVAAATLMEMQDLWRTVHYQQDDMGRATAEVREEYRRLKAAYALAIADRDRLAADLKAAKQGAEEGEAQRERALQAARDELRQASVRIVAQGDAVSSAKAAAEAAEARAVRLAAELASSRDEVAVLHADLKAMASSLDGLRNQQRSIADAEAVEAEAEMVRLRTEVAAARGELRGAAAAKDAVAAEAEEALRSLRTESEAALRALEERLAAAAEDQRRADAVAMADERAAAAEAVERLGAHTAHLEALVASLEGAVDEQRARADAAEAEKASLQRAHAEAFDEERRRHSDEVEALQQQIDALAEAVNSSTAAATATGVERGVGTRRSLSAASSNHNNTAKNSRAPSVPLSPRGDSYVHIASARASPLATPRGGLAYSSSSAPPLLPPNADTNGAQQLVIRSHSAASSAASGVHVGGGARARSASAPSTPLTDRIASLTDELYAQQRRREAVEEALRSLDEDYAASEALRAEEAAASAAAMAALEAARAADAERWERQLQRQADDLTASKDRAVAALRAEAEEMRAAHQQTHGALAATAAAAEEEADALREALSRREADLLRVEGEWAAERAANADAKMGMQSIADEAVGARGAHDREMAAMAAKVAELEGLLAALGRVVEPFASPASRAELLLQSSSMGGRNESPLRAASASFRVAYPSGADGSRSSSVASGSARGLQSPHQQSRGASPLRHHSPLLSGTNASFSASQRGGGGANGTTSHAHLPALLDDLVAEVALLRRQKAADDDAIAALSSAVEEARHAHDALEGRMGAAAESLGTAAGREEHLAARLREVEGIATDLNAECASLQEALAAAEAATAAADHEKAALSDLVHSMRAEADRRAYEEALKASAIPLTATRGTSPFVRPAMERGNSPFRPAVSERGVSPRPAVSTQGVGTLTSRAPTPSRLERGVSPLLVPTAAAGTQSNVWGAASINARGTSPMAFSRTSSTASVPRAVTRGVGTSPFRSNSPIPPQPPTPRTAAKLGAYESTLEENNALRAEVDALAAEAEELRAVAQDRIADLHDLLTVERNERAALVGQLEVLQATYDEERAAHAGLKAAVSSGAVGGRAEGSVGAAEWALATAERRRLAERCAALEEGIAMRDARIADLKALLESLDVSIDHHHAEAVPTTAAATTGAAMPPPSPSAASSVAPRVPQHRYQSPASANPTPNAAPLTTSQQQQQRAHPLGLEGSGTVQRSAPASHASSPLRQQSPFRPLASSGAYAPLADRPHSGSGAAAAAAGPPRQPHPVGRVEYRMATPPAHHRHVAQHAGGAHGDPHNAYAPLSSASAAAAHSQPSFPAAAHAAGGDVSGLAKNRRRAWE